MGHNYPIDYNLNFQTIVLSNVQNSNKNYNIWLNYLIKVLTTFETIIF